MVPFPNLPASLADNTALRSQLEAQVGLLGELSLRTCDAMQRLSELHMQLARQLVEDAIATGRQVLACEDPLQMTTTAMRQLQPSGEHLRHYQQGLFGVLAGVQTDLQGALPPAMAEAERAATHAAQYARG
ncbi:phasin family protein [Massilia consociata]|uniref:Phasin family protein n=1 Tax=Massilia consociata TaxID=760117 RepID=A0ABV6FGF6_9BURK